MRSAARPKHGVSTCRPSARHGVGDFSGAVAEFAKGANGNVAPLARLTGARLFAGESVAETLGLIFSCEPDLATLPAATPAMSEP